MYTHIEISIFILTVTSSFLISFQYVFQSIFILLLGPFVFFNIQKTKYLQLLTSGMRWLAFTIMIVYALKNLIIHGVQGNPPAANIMGKFIYLIIIYILF
mgnify:CR=1 FL=1